MSLESDGTSSPSSTLRESFMHLLESRKDSIDVLGKELKIDTTQFKAVREVVSTYEERDGRELSQNKWGSIFKSLGCSEEFKTLLEEDLLLDVNSLDNCPPNNVSSQAKESLHKKSRGSELLSKPGDDVKETWKTSTDPGDCPEKSFSSSLDKPRTDVVNDSTREVKDDEVEHLYPEVGKAAESMVSSNGQNLDPHVRDVGEESYSTTQISEDGIFRSDDLSSRSPPATPEVRKAQLSIVTGYQFHPNNPITDQATVVYRDGQNLLENRSFSCAEFSPPDARSLATTNQFQLVTPSDAYGMDEEKNSGTLLQIETGPSLNSCGGGTRPGMVSPDVANSQSSLEENQKLQPSNLMVDQENGVDHDRQTLLENRMSYGHQFSPAFDGSILPVAAMQDSVNQLQQATPLKKYGTDEAEDSNSSSQSGTEASLSSGDFTTPSQLVTTEAANSPQLGQLQPNNLIAGVQGIAVNHDVSVLPGNRGIPLNPQFSQVSNASRLSAVSAIQDPVSQHHQGIAWDTEDSFSSSHSDTDGSLSSDDSRTQSRPSTPQPATSPQCHRLYPSNLMAGEANAAVNCDGPDLLETGGMPLNAPLSLAVSASSLPTVSSRSAIQDPVGQYHQATATDTHGTDEAEENISSSQSDTDGSLSSDDSRTQSRPFTPQAANSPRLHRLHPSNLMAGEANAVVNYDRPALLETRGMLLNAPLSPAVSARSLPVVPSRSGTDEAEGGSLSSDDSRTQARPFTPQAANSPPVHARFAMQDPVGHVHWGMAREMSRDEEENSNQPSENDDETQDMNILQQVQPLQFKDIAFLIQELQQKSTKLEACKQEVQHCRQQCAQLQGINDELKRFLDDSNHLQQENQRLIRMTREMCELKGQEIQQLRQLYEQKEQEVERLTVENESLRGKQIQMLRQMAQINDSSQQQIEQLRREGQERSEELRQTVQVVEQTQRELEAERESLRLENERMLDQRMTDEVKVLKRELDEQKRKGTEAEEHIKCLLEKNYQLYAMMEELMSRPAEGADVCCSASSPDTLQENLVSSSNDSTVEEADEESDEDEEVFEDALDQLQLQGTNLAPSSTF